MERLIKLAENSLVRRSTVMFFRWMVPVCSGGSEEHPRGLIGCPRGPKLEPWRPVLLLLPLAEGTSRRHTAAVCQEERTRPEVVKPVHDFDCEGKGIWMTLSRLETH